MPHCSRSCTAQRTTSRNNSERNGTVLFAFLLAFLLADITGAAEPSESNARTSLGSSIFNRGITANQTPVTAITSGDVVLTGQQTACRNCHGAAGLGSGEGEVFSPPVNTKHLFAARSTGSEVTRGTRTLRSAYSPKTLATVLADGTTPDGKRLHPLMPRYNFSSVEVNALLEYLAHLSKPLSTGVDDKVIRLATIVQNNYRPAEQAAYLSVLQAFVADKNAQTRGESARKRNAPAYRAWRDESFRSWQLDIWRVDSAPTMAELQKRYDEAPPFLVLGGHASSWDPMHEFCEHNQVPCILPLAPPPSGAPVDTYSLYFSRGPQLIADLFVEEVVRHAPTDLSVVQVHDKTQETHTFKYLSQRLSAMGIETTSMTAQQYIAAKRIKSTPVWTLFWNNEPQAMEAYSQPNEQLFIPSGASGWATELPTPARWRVIRSGTLPIKSKSDFRKVRPWMYKRDIPQTEFVGTKMNALFSASLVSQSLKHIGSNFDRRYFIDRLEHVFDNMVLPSGYLRPSLAPGQRYASRGGYILPADANDAEQKATHYIVPKSMTAK